MVVVCFLASFVYSRDLPLEEALSLAEQNTTEIHALQAKQTLAEATHKRSAQAFLPKISADAGWLRANSSLFDGVPMSALGLPSHMAYQDLGRVEGSFTGIQILQPLFHADAHKTRRQAARNVEAQRLLHRWGRRLVRMQVVEHYYAVTVRKSHEKTARMALEAAHEAWNLADAAYREGLAPKLDVARAGAEVKGRMANVEVAEANVQKARFALKTLLGLPLQEPLSLISDFPTLVAPLTTPLPPAERSDFLAWKAKHAAASAGVEKAKARWLPRANLLARQQWVDIDDPYETHGDSWLVAVQLEWTLFDGLGRQGKIAEARARETLARTQEEQARREVAQQQSQTMNDWRAGWAALQASDEAIEAANEALAIARSQYEEGVGNMTDLLATQATLYQRRLEHNRYQYNVLMVSMNYYLHHGLDPLRAIPERR